MTLDDILRIGVQGGASDIHLKATLPAMFRIGGKLVALRSGERLSPGAIREMVFALLDDRQKAALSEQRELDVAHGVSGLGRFRLNIYHQRGSLGVAIRVIPMRVPTFEELELPPVLTKIAEIRRGLVLVTGTTSSGKSSTLAAILNHINTTRSAHIMTIEDPIEFLIRDQRAMINQRELGVDTLSFSRALRAAMRQDPDVILIGELRDAETIATAFAAAETGHLVLSTLHTMDAPETITRLVSVFEPHIQASVRLQLAAILKAVVSQRLVPRAEGKGRVPAVEVMINNTRIATLIQEQGPAREILDTIAQGHRSYGMQSFDQSLMRLLRRGLISQDEAIRQASNPDDFSLRLSGIHATSDGNWEDFDAEDESEIPAIDDASIERL